MNGVTLKRLESLALRELAIMLQNDSKNRNFINTIITEVRITSDLSYMTVYFSCYDSKDKEIVLESLESEKGYIRTYLARKIKARKMPDLIFKYDEALEYGNKINNILADLNKK